MGDLENLLLLDGEIFPMDNGYWVKFEAKVVEASENIPHGVRYSLTLHDKNNHRIIGYDNAHSYKPSSFRYGARKPRGTIYTRKKKPFRMSSIVPESLWKISGTVSITI